MGRQLQLATTGVDEIELLRFVRTIAPIRVFQPFAHSVEDLWIDDWEVNQIQSGKFQIWPQTFAWSPKYAQTGGPKCPPERAGLFYISNSNVAPILEVNRSFLDRKNYGRIYWAKDFSAPNRLDYDVEAFAHLTDSVWRWIRKTGKRQQNSKIYSPYFLPDAWTRYGKVAA